MAIRVVYDCMVFVQGVLKDVGPSAACLYLAEARRVSLLLCPSILAELRDVLSRDALRKKSPNLTDASVARFVARAQAFSENLPEPSSAFSLPRDPKDEPYLSLAIQGDAKYLVSWNERHLNYLMKSDTPEGRDFGTRFPGLKILTPPEFLAEVRETMKTEGEKDTAR